MSELLPVEFYWVVVQVDMSIKAVFPWSDKKTADDFAATVGCTVCPGVIQGNLTYLRT